MPSLWPTHEGARRHHRAHAGPMKKIILDMDSSVSETYGWQEGTAAYGTGR
jgi:hypothetical protein